MTADTTIRVGTRGSPLALAQAGTTARELAARTGRNVELVIVRTGGDSDRATPLREFGGVGVFAREIDERQLAGDVDVSVHSLKDLPTEGREAFTLAAVPRRAESADALVASGGRTLADLPAGATVGTSSLRRRAQLLRARGDLEVAELRGNVESRLAAVEQGRVDAVLLACAGLERLGLAGRVTEVLAPDVMLPAAAQGALAVVTRRDDLELTALVALLDHAETRAAVTAERAVLGALGGGCHLPVGVHGSVVGDRLSLVARVVSADGRRTVERAGEGPVGAAAALGRRVAAGLVEDGAAEILG